MPHYAVVVPPAAATARPRDRYFYVQAPTADAARGEVARALSGGRHFVTRDAAVMAAAATVELQDGPVITEWWERATVDVRGSAAPVAAAVVHYHTRYVGDAPCGVAVRVVVAPRSVTDPVFAPGAWPADVAARARAIVAHLRLAAEAGTEFVKRARPGGRGYLSPERA